MSPPCLTRMIALLTLLAFTSCAAVHEVVEAYGAELGIVQRTAKPKAQAKIEFFTRFNTFLKFEAQLETMGDISFETLLQYLVQIQEARTRLDPVYCEGDLCNLSKAPKDKMFRPGFSFEERVFPSEAGPITLPEALARLQAAQQKILDRSFATCAVAQMRLFAQSEDNNWGRVKISYRVQHHSINKKMDFPAWPVSCSAFIKAGNQIPTTFKKYRKKIRQLCGQKIEFAAKEWEFEQKTVTRAQKTAFAKCWLKTSSRRWFSDATLNPELYEQYPGLYNSGCHENGDYICKQVAAAKETGQNSAQ